MLKRFLKFIKQHKIVAISLFGLVIISLLSAIFIWQPYYEYRSGAIYPKGTPALHNGQHVAKYNVHVPKVVKKAIDAHNVAPGYVDIRDIEDNRAGQVYFNNQRHLASGQKYFYKYAKVGTSVLAESKIIQTAYWVTDSHIYQRQKQYCDFKHSATPANNIIYTNSNKAKSAYQIFMTDINKHLFSLKSSNIINCDLMTSGDYLINGNLSKTTQIQLIINPKTAQIVYATTSVTKNEYEDDTKQHALPPQAYVYNYQSYYQADKLYTPWLYTVIPYEQHVSLKSDFHWMMQKDPTIRYQRRQDIWNDGACESKPDKTDDPTEYCDPRDHYHSLDIDQGTFDKGYVDNNEY